MVFYFVFNFKTKEILDYFTDEHDCLCCLENYCEYPEVYFEDPSYVDFLLTSCIFVPSSVLDVYDFIVNNFEFEVL